MAKYRKQLYYYLSDDVNNTHVTPKAGATTVLVKTAITEVTPPVVCPWYSFPLPVTHVTAVEPPRDRCRVAGLLFRDCTVMAVPRRSHCGLAQSAVALRKFWTCSKFASGHREGFDFFAVLRRSMTEPQLNHGDHGGATAVYAVQAPQWHRAFGVTGYKPI